MPLSTALDGPALDLAAMAALVQDLLAAGPDGRRDSTWLRGRGEAAGLGAEACGALEALRLRLAGGGALLAQAVDAAAW